jgi:hypothetical protein
VIFAMLGSSEKLASRRDRRSAHTASRVRTWRL